jgi:hypothetical protein
MTTLEVKILAIDNRINLLNSRNSACAAIIKKLERKKRALLSK